jgi:tetratricopeptide (TPR) repeat protein
MPRGEIANRLGVDAVLEGVLSVLDGSAGRPGRLRLDATLRTGTGATLWSGFAVRNRGESAALLSDIASNVARAVRVPVTAEEKARLRQVRRTNPAAEEAYLQGRVQLSGFGPEPAQRALAAFQRASTLDPNYGEAHAGAALAYLKLGAFSVLSHPDARLSARAEIRKAFESGEDIAEAHAAEADVKFLYDWDWEGAERDYRRSLDLNPSLVQARNNFAQVLATRGRFDESLRIAEETLRMDPESIDALISQGLLLYYKRDFTTAQAVSDRAVAQEPGNPAAHFLLSRVAEAQGRYADALAAADQALQLSGTPGVNLRVATIRLQALSGRKDEALVAANALVKAGQQGTLRVRPRDRAYLYLGLGQAQAALDAFAEAFDERDPTLVWLPVEPRVDVLRTDPRFQALLRQLAE